MKYVKTYADDGDNTRDPSCNLETNIIDGFFQICRDNSKCERDCPTKKHQQRLDWIRRRFGLCPPKLVVGANQNLQSGREGGGEDAVLALGGEGRSGGGRRRRDGGEKAAHKGGSGGTAFSPLLRCQPQVGTGDAAGPGEAGPSLQILAKFREILADLGFWSE